MKRTATENNAANNALRAVVDKRINEIWTETSNLESRIKLVNSMLATSEYAVLIFAAIATKIIADNGRTSLGEIMISKEMNINHKTALATYLLKNNLLLIETLIKDNLTPSTNGIIEQAISNVKLILSPKEHEHINNSAIIRDFLVNQSSIKTKVTTPLHRLADNVHEQTRQLGVPDGAASAATVFLATAALIGTGVGPGIALAAAAGYIGGKFGDKPDNSASNPATPMSDNDEFKALLTLREPIAGLLNSQFSAANMLFAVSNIIKCKSIKDAFQNPDDKFEPTLIESRNGNSCVFFKDSQNTLKIGVMKGRLNAEGTQVTALKVDDMLQYKYKEPTMEEYLSMSKSHVEVKAGPNGIAIINEVLHAKKKPRS